MLLSKKDFIVKRNDLLPAIELCLFDKSPLTTKIPFDLTGATACTFSMTDKNGNYTIAGAPAAIVNSSGGTIQYEWQEGDTIKEGRYKGEFQIVYNDGRKMSVPLFGFLNITITPDIVI